MKFIKLLCDLPIESKHGAVAGACFQVIAMDPPGRFARGGARRKVYFMGKAGQRCAAYFCEVQFIVQPV